MKMESDKKSIKNLFSAIQKDDLRLIQDIHKKEIIEWKTCIQKPSGDTALHIAGRYGSSNVIRWLLGDASDGCIACLEQQNFDGKRPLHEAALHGNLTAIRMFLDAGCVVDPLKRADWTPLMMSSTKHNLEVIKILITAGANLQLTNKDGWTTFHIACREGDDIIINYLLDIQMNIWRTISKNGRTPLHTAAMHGKLSTVTMLLTRGQYIPDEMDCCGNTPLMEAARMGHIEVVKLLLKDHNASPATRDKLGKCCLHISSEAGQTDVVNMLVKEVGVDVTSLSSDGYTSIHCAAKEGQDEIIKLLASLGCDINHLDHRGRSALWHADAAKKKKCCEVLYSLGAS